MGAWQWTSSRKAYFLPSISMIVVVPILLPLWSISVAFFVTAGDTFETAL